MKKKFNVLGIKKFTIFSSNENKELDGFSVKSKTTSKKCPYCKGEDLITKLIEEKVEMICKTCGETWE